MHAEVNRSPNELTSLTFFIMLSLRSGLKKMEAVEADIVKIDNEVDDKEAKIDTFVFKLYELKEDEIKVIFDSLTTPTIHQGRVLKFFRKL